ncbi:MAG TPA: TetR/AcrR family transcriptional regulator [Acidimicrobiales bacterium]|nr:TetR/AcrR family transcriptional regulator [Acidimicrobiales bacterium]
MPSVKRPSGRRRGGVTVDDVVAAAIDIVDREGVDALTIRRVAEACGLSPMGLYRHVRDKDDLLDRVVDAVVGPGLRDLQASGSWDQQVADLCRYLRRLLLDHPGVAVLCVLRPTPVVGVARFYARVLTALAEGGFTGTDAVHAFDTLLMFMLGSVLWQIPRATGTRERLVAVAIGDEAATQIIELANELRQRDPTEYFETGLNTVLDGLRVSRP